MPLRLIGRFDQRWRDTPVKNQQPPVPPLSLCIPLSLSLSLPLPCSVFLSPLFISHPLSFVPPSLYFFCLISSISLFPTLCLSLSLSHANAHISKGQSSRLVSTMLHLMPAPHVVAQSCPQEAVAQDRWPIALLNTHHTHKTGSINKHTLRRAHAYDFLQYTYTNKSYKSTPDIIRQIQYTAIDWLHPDFCAVQYDISIALISQQHIYFWKHFPSHLV